MRIWIQRQIFDTSVNSLFVLILMSILIAHV